MVEVIHRLGWKYVSTVAVEGEYGEKVGEQFVHIISIYFHKLNKNIPITLTFFPPIHEFSHVQHENFNTCTFGSS